MASTINADDGVISGSAGVKTTPDASGDLTLQTNGADRLKIGSDGRLQINGSSSTLSTLVITTGTFPLNLAQSAYQYRADCTFGTANTNAVGFGSTYQLPATGAFSSSYQFYVDTLATGGATLTNNYGVFVATQTVGTNIYGVFSNIASGANRYNFYANGTAENYFEGGVTIGRTAVTSPASTDGNVFSGTYTPTLTNVTNVAASTAYQCQYMRVGNVVTVSGRVNIDATTTSTNTTLGVSLPIASNFASAQNAGGSFSPSAAALSVSGVVYADTTNDRASFRILIDSAAANDYYFSFTYLVI